MGYCAREETKSLQGARTRLAWQRIKSRLTVVLQARHRSSPFCGMVAVTAALPIVCTIGCSDREPIFHCNTPSEMPMPSKFPLTAPSGSSRSSTLWPAYPKQPTERYFSHFARSSENPAAGEQRRQSPKIYSIFIPHPFHRVEDSTASR